MVLGDALATQHCGDSAQEDSQVECEAHRLDVAHVEIELIVPVQAVTPADLGEPAQPCPHVVSSRLLLGIEAEIVRCQRPWADHAHIPDQNVPQAGQFVQARGAQQPAESGEPVLIADPAALRVSCPHRTELAQPEDPLPLRHALLDEDHRCAMEYQHQQRDHRHHRAQQQQCKHRTHHIEPAFDLDIPHDVTPPLWPVGTGADQRGPADGTPGRTRRLLPTPPPQWRTAASRR